MFRYFEGSSQVSVVTLELRVAIRIEFLTKRAWNEADHCYKLDMWIATYRLQYQQCNWEKHICNTMQLFSPFVWSYFSLQANLGWSLFLATHHQVSWTQSCLPFLTDTFSLYLYLSLKTYISYIFYIWKTRQGNPLPGCLLKDQSHVFRIQTRSLWLRMDSYPCQQEELHNLILHSKILDLSITRR